MYEAKESVFLKPSCEKHEMKTRELDSLKALRATMSVLSTETEHFSNILIPTCGLELQKLIHSSIDFSLKGSKKKRGVTNRVPLMFELLIILQIILFHLKLFYILLNIIKT